MRFRSFACGVLGAAIAALGLSGGVASAQEESAIPACATTPDLASLLDEIGGDQVAVTAFSKPTEDPHFLDAKPSFVKRLSESHLLVLTGLDLEAGYLPSLLQNARNARILKGAAGHIDASSVIEPREIPAGAVDRSMGDVHALGNPHYLLDPLNGLRVAELLRDRLTVVMPSHEKRFAERYEAFRGKVAEALLGKTLAEKYRAEFEKLVKLHEHGRMIEFLQKKGDEAALGGWLKALSPHHGVKVVADHNLWTYFVARFGLAVVGTMEPRPGIPPTTKHLGALVDRMRSESVRAILAAPYYDPRHANFLAEHTSAKVAAMAHQPGSRDATGSYLAMIDHNVRQVAAALGAGR